MKKLLMLITCAASVYAAGIDKGLSVEADVVTGIGRVVFNDPPENGQVVKRVEPGRRTVVVRFTNLEDRRVRLPTRGFSFDVRRSAQGGDVLTLLWSESDTSGQKIVVPAEVLGIVELDKGEVAVMAFEYPQEWRDGMPLLLRFEVSNWAAAKYRLDWYSGEVRVKP